MQACKPGSVTTPILSERNSYHLSGADFAVSLYQSTHSTTRPDTIGTNIERAVQNRAYSTFQLVRFTMPLMSPLER